MGSHLLRTFSNLATIKSESHQIFNVKISSDKNEAAICDIAVTGEGRRIFCDFDNKKLKIFSPDMHLQSSLTLPSSPYSVAVLDEKEAVLSTGKDLHFVDISTNSAFIKRSLKFPYKVFGVTPCEGKLAICCFGNPRSVRLIDREGNIYWEVSRDVTGKLHRFFRSPGFITNYISDTEGNETVLAVSDAGDSSLTLLDGSTGSVLAVQKLRGTCSEGVTTDLFGNLYICCGETDEVAVWSGDLSNNKILLTSNEGVSNQPWAIAFDQKYNILVISNKETTGGSCNYIDCYKVTFNE